MPAARIARAQQHFELLELGSLYAGSAAVELVESKDTFRRNFAAGADILRSELNHTARSRQRGNLNAWRAALSLGPCGERRLLQRRVQTDRGKLIYLKKSGRFTLRAEVIFSRVTAAVAGSALNRNVILPPSPAHPQTTGEGTAACWRPLCTRLLPDRVPRCNVFIIAPKFSSCCPLADARMSRTSQLSPGVDGGDSPSESGLRSDFGVPRRRCNGKRPGVQWS